MEALWLVRERAVPPELCSELADRIEWELAACAGAQLEGSPAMVDVSDERLLESLWEHLQELPPSHVEGCALMGPHAVARLLRSEATPCAGTGPTFSSPLHADTPVAVPGARSRLTMLVYVSSGFAGGAVRFFGDAGEVVATVQPAQGTVVLFDHRLRHEAAAVTRGTKRLVKLSLLYASVSEDAPAPTGQTPQPEQALQEMLQGLVSRAEVEKEPQAAEKAQEELLDFLVAQELASWPGTVLARAFMPLTMALNSERLKLRAYQVFVAAVQLHGDERCILLGETLMKDATDSDPAVRLAVLEALFSGLTQNWGETTRSGPVLRIIRQDPCPAVRLRALDHLGALAEASVGESEDAAESTRELSDIYGEALREAAASAGRGGPSGGEDVVGLAARVLAVLASPPPGRREESGGHGVSSVPTVPSLLD